LDDSQTGINEISPKGLPLHEDAFASIYAKTFLNPPPLQQANYNVVPENGELLIIVPGEFAETIAPLVDWKIKKGIKTTVIQVNPNPTVTDTEIKTIVQDFYTTNPDLANVLLIGDSDKLASYTYGFISGEDRWSDSYYGQLEGGDNDLYPEVFVGRFSGNLQQIQTMVARTLEYETNPIDGDWMTNAAGIASNEGGGFGNDGESDFQHLRNIGSQLLDYNFSYVYEFYQGNQGGLDAFGEPTDAMINQAMDAGIGLLNYTGHGWLEGMATGSYNNWSVDGLNNNGKYPFVISVACNNGTFVGATCLSEAFLSAGTPAQPKGAIAMAASSILMAWAEPMETQDEMTNILTKIYSNNEKETLGGLFYNAQIGMLTAYNNSYTAREVMQTWVLFGDPTVTYRYRESENIIASHPASGPENMTSFTIECETDGVLFVISQDGIILGTAVSSGGVATITGIVLNSDSDLTIVGTKQNFIPYEGTVALSGLSDENFSWNTIKVYPNPAQDYLHINWAGQNMTSIELIDISGKVVLTVKPTNQSNYTIDISAIADGFYLLKLANETSQDIRKIIIK
jgi:gingipain R